MVGKLLVRGMLAGIAAGLLTFGFARVVGEPQVDQAISFEEKADAAKGEAPEPELVSRGTQAGLGLLTGVVTYGAAFGGLFSLVFAYAYGRVGTLSARALSAWLALGAFITLVIVPNIKYPANPPSVGDPETIGMRTGLFFLMIAISLAAMVFSLKVRRRVALKLGAWNGVDCGGRGVRRDYRCGPYVAGVERQQIFDVAQAEGEPEVEPYRLVNDLNRETISAVADFVHPFDYAATVRTATRRDVTMPPREVEPVQPANDAVRN